MTEVPPIAARMNNGGGVDAGVGAYPWWDLLDDSAAYTTSLANNHPDTWLFPDIGAGVRFGFHVRYKHVSVSGLVDRRTWLHGGVYDGIRTATNLLGFVDIGLPFIDVGTWHDVSPTVTDLTETFDIAQTLIDDAVSPPGGGPFEIGLVPQYMNGITEFHVTYVALILPSGGWKVEVVE